MLFERIPLEADEHIITIVRKHWWWITLETLVVVSFALLPVIVVIAANAFFPTLGTQANTSLSSLLAAYKPQLWFLYLGWLLIQWMALANFWTDYYLDLWAITNRRVILVDQRGFFRRFISSFRLERLQDMNIEVNGIIATLLDFGTIEAQTAGGSNEEFKSHHMPKPREIKALIVRIADELTEREPQRSKNLETQGL